MPVIVGASLIGKKKLATAANGWYQTSKEGGKIDRPLIASRMQQKPVSSLSGFASRLYGRQSTRQAKALRGFVIRVSF